MGPVAPAAGEAWLDPRPPRSTEQLARRGAATGRRLVFHDNGKLSPPYARWLPTEPPLLAHLRAMGTVRRQAADLLMESPERHAGWVQAWRDDGIDGVVFALCDAGVTQPTLALAAAAEAAGIPTAVVCTADVMDLAATCAHFLMPGLPLVELHATRLNSPDRLAAAAHAAGQELRSALCDEPSALRRRADERFPFVRGLDRGESDSRIETSGAIDFDEFARSRHLSDGVPVLAPTPARVESLLEAAGCPPETVLNPMLIPSGAALTVHGAAICAAMAACEPRWFPLVLVALRAMAEPRYLLTLGATTTHPGANLMLFSGPAAHAAGVASGRGCLGPGHAANLAIGRSVGLALQNVGRAIPGLSNLSLLGSPGQLACVFADLEDAPLPPLHTELAGPGESIVWVHKTETPRNLVDHISETPESLLGTVASVAATLAGNNAYMPSELLVILNPEHAEIARRAGWSRADMQRYLWEQARNPREALLTRGLKPHWPAAWHEWDRIPVAAGPEQICIVVAGAPGPQSQVSVPWGHSRASWARL